jgi:hypothetical protein
VVRNRLLIALALVAVLPSLRPAFADDYEDDQEKLPFGYVRSVDVMAGPHATGGTLLLAAEYATALHNFDQAISYCRRALRETEGDLDVHVAYAKAMVGKMSTQPNPDPEMFNACVREWLIVLRTEKGEESGINRKNGIGGGALNKLYEDEDHSMLAATCLKAMVGSLPKGRETDEKYMKRVCKNTEWKVTGQLVDKKKSKQQQQDSEPTLWMK